MPPFHFNFVNLASPNFLNEPSETSFESFALESTQIYLVLCSFIRKFVANMGKIIIAGIGPGSKEDITPAVLEAVREADTIVGYKYYFQFIEPYV